jgi:crotonobetainyl-CoA:carnitine CoA-transferase CaiB-like acyl-CoA transferase
MLATESLVSQKRRPLDGIRIIELGQLLAGPFAGCMLAYFGAEVIKIEPPKTGDPIRGWRVLENGTSLWWRSLGRNKKSITLDLKKTEAQNIARQLIDTADVIIENFRPGVMESWGLGPDEIKTTNPKCIYARISGYGQTGPYANKPGFASVCEGMSGFRFVNGFADQAPVRPNLSIGDTIAGIHAALGITLALLERERNKNDVGQALGQVVDVALYESMFNLMEAMVPEFDGAGIIRQPSGTTVTGIVPTNTYRCKNKKYLVIGGNGDSIFQRLMAVAGYPEMAQDPRMVTNAGRVIHEAEIDHALATWCLSKNSEEILMLLDEARVPGGPIYNVEDMFSDPHFQARGMFEQVEIDGKPLKIPAILPKLSETPGRTDWPGLEVGSHTQDILQNILKLSDDEINALKNAGII